MSLGHITKTDFDYICVDISHAIDALYRLTTLIQKPSKPEKVQKYATIDVSHFELYEKLRIQDKYKLLTSSEEYLVNRLVGANLRRRQIFTYTKAHHVRVSAEPVAKQPFIKPSEEGIPLHPNSGVVQEQRKWPPVPASIIGSFPQATTVATTFVDIKPVQQLDLKMSDHYLQVQPSAQSEEGSQVTSTVSTMYPAQDGGAVYSIPPPPGGESIFNGNTTCLECPYCLQFVRISTKNAWK